MLQSVSRYALLLQILQQMLESQCPGVLLFWISGDTDTGLRSREKKKKKKTSFWIHGWCRHWSTEKRCFASTMRRLLMRSWQKKFAKVSIFRVAEKRCFAYLSLSLSVCTHTHTHTPWPLGTRRPTRERETRNRPVWLVQRARVCCREKRAESLRASQMRASHTPKSAPWMFLLTL